MTAMRSSEMAERPDPLVGTMLGKDYRVLQPLGAGGMAVVYLVEHQTLLKQFAAKVLSRELASSLEARARFAQEAHAASQLDHENIVTISDFGVTFDHLPFFVMELLRGQTLDARLAEGPMTLEEVVAVAVPVARALAHAHAEGIVHLDVKPENIFLVQRSQHRWGVKVVDFGIAKTPQSPRIGTPGETAGSPMFMAPEVCTGSDDVDQRADVYSFGILLYLMLCGRPPFSDPSLARVLEMQLVELPRPPRQLNAELSPEIAAIIERALAKQPGDRYPSMEALLRDLDAALPLGADRLLIEAQTGTSLGDTPFAGGMSVDRHDSHRMRRASAPVRPHATPAPSRPAARLRPRFASIVWPSVAVVIALAGAAAWRQFAGASANAATPPVAAAAPLPAVVAAAAPLVPSEIAAERPARVAPAPAAAPARGARGASEDTARDGSAMTSAAPDAKRGATEPLAGPATRPTSATRRVAKRLAAAGPITGAGHGAPAGTAWGTATAVATERRAPPGAATDAAPARRADEVVARPSAPAAVAAPLPGAPTTSATAPTRAAPAGAAPLHAQRSGDSPGFVLPAAVPPDAARPAAAPGTAPSTLPAVAPSGPGSFDAVPSITALGVKGSLSPSLVRRSVDRVLTALRACYRTAARAGGATPAIELQLTFEIDENGLATQVATSGAPFGSLPGCVADVAGQIRTQEAPDVGTAHVTVSLRFRPS